MKIKADYANAPQWKTLRTLTTTAERAPAPTREAEVCQQAETNLKNRKVNEET